MKDLIGARLRTARLLAGFSQAEAAYDLNLSQQTVSGWEKGTSTPAGDMLVKVCALYGVAPNYILLADASPHRYMACPPDGRLQCRVMQERAWAPAI